MRLTSTLLRAGQRALRGAAYVAVVAKLLVPAGYMPGPLAAGLPVQLCDAGFAPVVRFATVFSKKNPVILTVTVWSSS